MRALRRGDPARSSSHWASVGVGQVAQGRSNAYVDWEGHPPPLRPADRMLRLATWNCCAGPLARKLDVAATLEADILVVPECPAFPKPRPGHFWTGTSPRKGLAVIASQEFSLRRATRRTLPEFVVPLMVEGPVSFLLLAVWMKGKGPDRYVRGLNRAIDSCRALIRRHPTVVLGDFNSNAIWDHEHPNGLDHSSLVTRLGDLGLESAYHSSRKEPHGKEKEPTFYFYRRKSIPYHLDYCFIPRPWLPQVREVGVGGWKEWHRESDHTPVWCDLALGGPGPGGPP